ncbi:MAG: sigma-70 family RNA polymerase sigma factor [Anaerolineales bacterium]|jgi:RNA polymerase sigma-70 factor (ECF subfamily)
MDEIFSHERAIQAMKARKAGPVDSSPASSEASLSSQSFEDVFLEHWSSIYRLLAHITGDPAEAEDLALETFFRFYRQPPKIGEGYNPDGWLYRVATNLALSSIRSTKHRQHYEMSAGKGALVDPPENRPAQILERKEEHRMTRLALAKMNPRRAGMLVLRYSGMAYKDIAKSLGVSPTSVGPLLLRAEREFEKVYLALTEEEK